MMFVFFNKLLLPTQCQIHISVPLLGSCFCAVVAKLEPDIYHKWLCCAYIAGLPIMCCSVYNCVSLCRWIIM